MLPEYCFGLISLLFLILKVFRAGMHPLPALLISAGVFLLLHVLYFILIWLAACTVDLDKPLKKQNAFCRYGTGFFSGIINFFAGIRPVINGMDKLPTERRFLYVSNHRSIFDPLIVMDRLRAYNISFISKPENMKLPFVGRIAYADGFLPIDRENDRNAMRTILTAADYLKRDICSIGVYPEGTRSKSEQMLPFHAGSLKIAQKAKAPIVVASVHGTEKLRSFRLFSGVGITLNILEVIPAETVCALRTTELTEHIRAVIQADLDRGKNGVQEKEKA